MDLPGQSVGITGRLHRGLQEEAQKAAQDGEGEEEVDSR